MAIYRDASVQVSGQLVGIKISAVAVVLFLWFACLNKSTFGQKSELIFKNVSVSDGLSHATAHHIMQDSRGLIWISTRDGLNRYDGQSFKILKQEPDNPNSLSANTVWLSLEDSEGLIWIGTNGGGLNVYDPEKERFHHFLHEPQNEQSISANTVISILEDKQGTIWVGTENGGLNKVISKRWNGGDLELAFKHYLPDSTYGSITNSTVMDIAQQDSSHLWIATYGGGLNRFDIENETFRSDFEIGGRYVMSLALNDKRLWAGTKYNGLSLLNLADESLRVFRHNPDDAQTLTSNFIWPVYIDKDGDVWAGTFGGGLNKITVGEEDGDRHFSIKSYQKNSTSSAPLPDNYVASVFQDNNDDLWIATDNAGVAVFRKTKFFREPDIEILNSGLDVSDLKFNDFLRDDQGNRWMGTTSGLLFQPSGSLEAKFISNGESKVVNVLKQIPDGTILVGTNVGLYRVDKNDLTLSKQPVSQFPGGITLDRVYDIIQTTGRDIWLSTNTGLWKLNPKLDVVDRLYHDPQKENSLSGTNTGRLFLEKDTLWIATSTAGLNKLNLKTGKIEQFRHRSDKSTTIGSNKILDMFRDRAGRFWVATYGGGLNKLIYHNGEPVFKKFLEEDGLPDNTVKNLALDEAENLWITTQQGMARMDPQKEKIVPVSVPVENSNLNLNKVIPSGDSEYILTSSKGYRLFNPRNFLRQRRGVPLLLTGLGVNDREYPVDGSYPATQKMTLSYQQNFLTFTFSLLDYFSSDFANYQYKMENMDRDWEQAVNQNTVNYSALPPGDYTFRVKATSYDGTPAQNQLAVEVSILPPFWQTWWFWSSLIVVAVIFLVMIYRYRVNALLEVERTRRGIASDLHDDISTTLSSITYFARALRMNYPHLTSSRNLNLILDSSASAKEKISDIVWSIDPEHDDWMDLLSRCRRFASDVFDSKNISYRLDIIEEVDTKLDVRLRKELWLIFKEMVTNAARHSQARKVWITINYADDTLSLVVKDDGVGVGIEENSSSEGKGISNIRQRALTIGADASLSSAPGEGTTWELTIKL